MSANEPAYAWAMLCMGCGQAGLATEHVKAACEAGAKCPRCHGTQYLNLGKAKIGTYTGAASDDGLTEMRVIKTGGADGEI